MAVVLAALARDLVAETRGLEQLLEELDAATWKTSTPSPGWRVHDQVSHLAYFDYAATLSARAPDRFRHELEDARTHPDGITERIRKRYAELESTELLAWFQDERAGMLRTFIGLDPSTRVPWYGPDMSAASALTARIMETWAHGQDIADAIRAPRSPTSALRHVAHLGVRTRPNSFRARGLRVRDEPVYVALRAPDGDTWTWDTEPSPDRVIGNALEFCLVVTQRRHVDDTSLEIEGPVARQWMAIAQAFAGPPGQGRLPTQHHR
jgi:uncharacterized protein (TIGR03084 family)